MRALVVVFALLAVVVSGCGGETAEEAAPPDTTTATTTATETARAREGGRVAPAIEGTTLEGERLSLADFRGRPVLVNVWAAW